MQVSFLFFMSIPDLDNQTQSIVMNYKQKEKKKTIKAIINKHKQPMCKPLKLLNGS